MPRGQMFLSGYPSGVIQIWDLDQNKEVRRIESPRGYRGSADYALTPNDFSTLYVPMDGRKVHRTPTNLKKPYTIAFDGEVLVWDLATGKPRASIKPSKGRGVITAHVSPDGKRLITVERGGFAAGEDPPQDLIRMYDTTSTRSWDLGTGYGMVVFSPDSRRIYVSRMRTFGNDDGSLLVFDSEGKELATLAQDKKMGMTKPVLSPNGKRLVVELSKGRINDPGTLKVFDIAARKEIASFVSAGNYPFLIPAFSPDGRFLAAGDYDGGLTIWDVDKKTVVRKQRFEGKGMGLTVAFSPDGTRLAVPMRVKSESDRNRDPDPLDIPQPRVYLFDLTKNVAPEEIVCPHGWTGGIAFSADGKTLAVGGAGAVHLFDMVQGKR
jgi:WD40 repeat protein